MKNTMLKSLAAFAVASFGVAGITFLAKASSIVGGVAGDTDRGEMNLYAGIVCVAASSLVLIAALLASRGTD
jgi:hypothetical protein